MPPPVKKAPPPAAPLVLATARPVRHEGNTDDVWLHLEFDVPADSRKFKVGKTYRVTISEVVEVK